MDRPAGCRHISVWIRRPADEVYRFAADPRNLPLWAAGLAQAELTRTGEVWVAQSPMGQVSVRFTPANDLGVLDHTVTLTNGERVFNPLRVLPAGAQVLIRGAYAAARTLPEGEPVAIAAEGGYTRVTLPEITGYRMIQLTR